MGGGNIRRRKEFREQSAALCLVLFLIYVAHPGNDTTQDDYDDDCRLYTCVIRFIVALLSLSGVGGFSSEFVFVEFSLTVERTKAFGRL